MEELQPEELAGLEAEANHIINNDYRAMVSLDPHFTLRVVREHRRLQEYILALERSL